MTVTMPPATRPRGVFPQGEWEVADTAQSGWSADGLAELSGALSNGGSTGMMIVDGGRVVFHWGSLAYRSSVASVRKSLVGLLYGMLVGEGTVRLDETLGELGIDDDTPLTEMEKTATVADLLKARSGVYLPSVYDTERDRPARGSHAPGTRWFYNNWDFNVLGTILSLRTGRTVFELLEERLARPLGMEDFSAADGRFQPGPQSRHPVYKLAMSGRDLARVGLLVLNDGVWNGRRIVPAAWLAESTRPHSDLGGGRGYGMLWNTAEAEATGDTMSVDVPMVYASGFGGQYVIVLRAYGLVVVHRAARVDHGISHARTGELLRLALTAMPGRHAA